MKYIAKTHEVEAIQCTIYNNIDVARFVNGDCVSHLNTEDALMSMWDHKGDFHKVFELDYIVKFPDNRVVVMGQDEFESLYEKCEDFNHAL